MRSALAMLLAKSPRLEDVTRTLIAPVRLHVFLPCQLKHCYALVSYSGLYRWCISLILMF